MKHFFSVYLLRKTALMLLLLGGALTSTAQLCNTLHVNEVESDYGFSLNWVHTGASSYCMVVTRADGFVVTQTPCGGLFFNYTVTGLNDYPLYYWYVTAECADGTRQTVSGTFSPLTNPDDDNPTSSPNPGNGDPNDPTAGWDPNLDPTNGDPDFWVDFLNGQNGGGSDPLGGTNGKQHFGSQMASPVTIRTSTVGANSLLNVYLSNAGLAQLQLTDLHGKQVASLGEIAAGTTEVRYDLQYLPNGIYLLSYQDGNIRLSTKVMVQR